MKSSDDKAFNEHFEQILKKIQDNVPFDENSVEINGKFNEKDDEPVPRVLSTENLRRLCTALRTNTSVQTLYLQALGFTDEDVKMLAEEGLKDNHTVVALILNVNSITDVGAGHLASLMRFNPTLRSLLLDDNNIGDTGALMLANIVQNNHNFEDLILRGNKEVGHKTLQLIALRLKENRTFRRNAIRVKEWQKICGDLETNANIRGLDLSSKKMTSEEAISIATALRNNHTVTELNLRNNESLGTRSVAAAFHSLLQVNSTLREIRFDNFIFIEDKVELLTDIERLLSINRDNAKIRGHNASIPPLRSATLLCLDKKFKTTITPTIYDRKVIRMIFEFADLMFKRTVPKSSAAMVLTQAPSSAERKNEAEQLLSSGGVGPRHLPSGGVGPRPLLPSGGVGPRPLVDPYPMAALAVQPGQVGSLVAHYERLSAEAANSARDFRRSAGNSSARAGVKHMKKESPPHK